MAKEAAKDVDKGWWFVIRQVKIFPLLDQNLFWRKNASHRQWLWIIPRTGMESLTNRVGTESFDWRTAFETRKVWCTSQVDCA